MAFVVQQVITNYSIVNVNTYIYYINYMRVLIDMSIFSGVMIYKYFIILNTLSTLLIFSLFLSSYDNINTFIPILFSFFLGVA